MSEQSHLCGNVRNSNGGGMEGGREGERREGGKEGGREGGREICTDLWGLMTHLLRMK